MKTPNYHDFYQMALIPIGEKDLMSLRDNKSAYSEATCSHWLIAVEGIQLSQTKIYYHWRVIIYPAACDGDFNWKAPYYYSINMEKMEQAMSLASVLITLSKQDELASSTLLEKIS